MVFSYHGEFSRFQVSKYIEYSAYTGCISLYIYCLITCNIKSLLNVPKISQISRKNSQVSRFPAKSPDSRNKFVFLPKQPLLELSPPLVLYMLSGEDHYCMRQKNGHFSLLLIAKNISPPETIWHLSNRNSILMKSIWNLVRSSDNWLT